MNEPKIWTTEELVNLWIDGDEAYIFNHIPACEIEDPVIANLVGEIEPYYAMLIGEFIYYLQNKPKVATEV